MRIAVIDSGSSNQANLNITEKYRIFVNQNYEIYDLKDDVIDKNGHATIIMKILEDYLKKTDEVISIKILNENLRGNSIALIRAIELALEKEVELINISLGTINTKYLTEIKGVIKKAHEIGVTIVAAHHNDKTKISYPASFNGVIGVGRVTSNVKKNIDVPESQKILLDGEYLEVYGNSYFSPHISGMIKKIKDEKRKGNFFQEILKRKNEILNINRRRR